jgi:hypothetical protein
VALKSDAAAEKSKDPTFARFLGLFDFRLLQQYRHRTDMPTLLSDVRCWVNSGKHMLAASISLNRGGVGARSLNIELQAALNPTGDQKIERFGWVFAPGDKVMQIQNDYDKEVYNGDIGYVEKVDLDDGELVASFDGRAVTYAFGELDTLVPAYAATIHKSQGSEYPAVVIPVSTTPCCNETCFIQVSPVAKSSLCSSVRRRPLPSLFAMSLGAGDGQN